MAEIYSDTQHALVQISIQVVAALQRAYVQGVRASKLRCLVQVHVRHLVGGRARGDQQLSNERLFTVAGPERIGAVSHAFTHSKLRTSFLSYAKNIPHG